MWDDFENALGGTARENEDLLKAMVVVDIEQRVQSLGNTPEMYDLPTIDDNLRARVQAANRRFCHQATRRLTSLCD